MPETKVININLSLVPKVVMRYHLSSSVMAVDKRVIKRLTVLKTNSTTLSTFVADKIVSFLATDDPDPKPMVNVCMNTVSFIVDSGSTHHLVNREAGKFLEKVEDINLFIQVAKKGGEDIVAIRCGNLEAILSNDVQ